MTIKRNSFNKALLATAVASGMALASAAQAQQTITFAPGTPSATGLTAAGASGVNYDGATPASVQTDRLNMVAVNSGLNENGVGTDINFGSWALNFAADGSFVENFRFIVLNAELNSALVETYSDGDINTAGIPQDNDLTQTFVTVTVSLSGTVAGGAATVTALRSAGTNTAIANLLDLTYDAGGTFDYFFHEDFDGNGTSSLIGSFELTAGSSDIGISDARIELGFDTVSDANNAPAFTDENGVAFNPITDLTQEFTQGVEVVSKSNTASTQDTIDPEDGDLNDGVQIAIRSRFVETGFAEFPAVPEPGTLALFGVGLLGLGFAARRRSVKVTKA